MRLGTLKFRHIGGRHGSSTLLSKKWIDEQFDRALVFALRGGFAANGNMLLHETRAKFYDGN